jgi:hypothetical protein
MLRCSETANSPSPYPSSRPRRCALPRPTLRQKDERQGLRTRRTVKLKIRVLYPTASQTTSFFSFFPSVSCLSSFQVRRGDITLCCSIVKSILFVRVAVGLILHKWQVTTLRGKQFVCQEPLLLGATLLHVAVRNSSVCCCFFNFTLNSSWQWFPDLPPSTMSLFPRLAAGRRKFHLASLRWRDKSGQTFPPSPLRSSLPTYTRCIVRNNCACEYSYRR